MHSGPSFFALLTSFETRQDSMSVAGYGHKSVFKNSGSNLFGSSHH